MLSANQVGTKELESALDESFERSLRHVLHGYTETLLSQLGNIDTKVLRESELPNCVIFGKFLELLKELRYRQSFRYANIHERTYQDLFLDEFEDMIFKYDFSHDFHTRRSMHQLMVIAIREAMEAQEKIRAESRKRANMPVVGFIAVKLLGCDPDAKSLVLRELFRCSDSIKNRIDKGLREKAGSYIANKDYVYTVPEWEELRRHSSSR
jgi:hypothetical protein